MSNCDLQELDRQVPLMDEMDDKVCYLAAISFRWLLLEIV